MNQRQSNIVYKLFQLLISVPSLQDHESTEHDGDVEDYSEGENGTTGSEKSHHRLMYYPSPQDTSSNQFTVNAMDVEELRRLIFILKKILHFLQLRKRMNSSYFNCLQISEASQKVEVQ